jgi:hypothetical protein
MLEPRWPSLSGVLFADQSRESWFSMRQRIVPTRAWPVQVDEVFLKGLPVWRNFFLQGAFKLGLPFYWMVGLQR